MSQVAENWYPTNSSFKNLVELNNQFYFMFQWALEANTISCYISARELPSSYGVVSWLLSSMPLYTEISIILPKGERRLTQVHNRIAELIWVETPLESIQILANLRELQFGPN